MRLRIYRNQRSMRTRPPVFAMAGSGEHDVFLKVLLIGDNGVGKSYVMNTYDEDFPHPMSLRKTTIGK